MTEPLASFLSESEPDADALRHFVAESNRIEGEPDEPGQRSFDDHLAVAFEALRRGRMGGRQLGPRAIHRALMRGEPEAWPGRYRESAVFVGSASVGWDEKMPHEQVSSRMASLIRRARRVADGAGSPAEKAGALWLSHLEFEAIHPFRDGNGRGGRLWLNELRMRAGLPWLTVSFERRGEYYLAIRRWEELMREIGEWPRGQFVPPRLAWGPH